MSDTLLGTAQHPELSHRPGTRACQNQPPQASLGDGCSPQEWWGDLGVSCHTAQISAVLGAGAAGVDDTTEGLLGQPGVSIPSPPHSPDESSRPQSQSLSQSPINVKMLSSTYKYLRGWRGLCPQTPLPLHPLLLQVEHPHLSGKTLKSSSTSPSPVCPHTERGCWGSGVLQRRPPSPPSAGPGLRLPPSLPPSAAPCERRCSACAERRREEEGEGKEGGGRGPPYLALSPLLPLTCSGRAMRLPASR